MGKAQAHQTVLAMSEQNTEDKFIGKLPHICYSLDPLAIYRPIRKVSGDNWTLRPRGT